MSTGKLTHERALLLRVADGDEQSFITIFDHYQPNIYHTAFRLTGDQWVAEEIVQDVFLKVWLKRETLPEIEVFCAWLYTIAQNQALSALKQLKFKRENITSWDGQAPSAWEEANLDLEEKEFRKLIQEAVNRLTPKQRETYVLIKEQGYKRNEAAAILQVSPETIKWNLDQAMQNIRAYCLPRMGQSYAIVMSLVIFKNLG
jgi:RNA polymerase sigma-70 factor (family 1)